jgi:HSP20 family protein
VTSAKTNRWTRSVDQAWENETVHRRWVPPVDILEDASRNVVIRVEVPEMTREDIRVGVENDTLTLQGERKTAAGPRDTFYRRERPHGEFRRSFTLPATLDASRIEASYRDGVLTVTIPPRAEARPRQIPVEAA